MRARTSISLLVLGLSLGGCVVDEAELDELVDEDLEDELDAEGGKADSIGLPLRFLPGNLTLPTHTLGDEVRRVFKNADDLEEALQIANPGIDFEEEWGVFYNPGLPSLLPGSRARIETVSLSQTGLTLKVTTNLQHNGEACAPRPTRPFVLVAVPIPDEPPPHTRFYRDDDTLTCGGETHDGVAFTPAQAEGALSAANLATVAELNAVAITGAQASIIVDGRAWPSLASVAGTTNVGPRTMEKLRALGDSF